MTSSLRLHVLQHVRFETPGSILPWAEQHGHSLSFTHYWAQEPTLPTLDTFDALLVLGGFMNVDEEDTFPWLRTEKEFIREAIAAGKKVLGICLGAQLIAAALGASVYSGREKEIGFFPIQYTAEALAHPLFRHFTNPYIAFQWHSDTFDIPGGAQWLATSVACPHQAFSIGNQVLALQFHLEMTSSILHDMLAHDGQELEESGTFIASATQIQRQISHLQQNQQDLFLLLDKFFGT
ncbi:MAG: type 1 glutamine amidotransferase [Lewinellaceae bacterium]|nr:type 1 glutamine amidotransferase [Lewinellaceae bacterium]